MNEDLFNELVLRFFDNELSPEEFTALQQTLRDSAEFRRRYRHMAELHGLLGPLLVPAKADPISLAHRSTKAATARKRRRRTAIALMAAVVVFAFVALQFLRLRPPAARLTFTSTPGSQVTVKHGSNESEIPGNMMRQGSRMVLQQGVAEVKLASGVSGFVSGPADFTLESGSHIRLEEGSVRFSVPSKAAGFKVTSADLEVVDLGTEFGMVAPHAGLGGEVHVFKGKVSATPTGGARTELAAGSARRVDAATGGFSETPLAEPMFQQALPGTLPYLHWSFDEVGPEGLQATGNHPAVAGMRTVPVQSDGRSAETRLVSGVRGRALSFDGVGDLVETNWPGISGDKPRTVVFWVRFPSGTLARYDSGGIVWGTRISPDEPVFWKFNFMASAPEPGLHLANPPVAVAYITFGRWWRYGTTNVADGRWHCLAVTYRGGLGKDGLPDVSLFVDGNAEATTSVDHRKVQRDRTPQINTRTDRPDSTPLIMGRSQRRLLAADQVPFRYFAGEMDELYIIEGALSADEIRKLSESRRFGEER